MFYSFSERHLIILVKPMTCTTRCHRSLPDRFRSLKKNLQNKTQQKCNHFTATSIYQRKAGHAACKTLYPLVLSLSKKEIIAKLSVISLCKNFRPLCSSKSNASQFVKKHELHFFLKSVSTRALSSRSTCHLTNFDETLPV